MKTKFRKYQSAMNVPISIMEIYLSPDEEAQWRDVMNFRSRRNGPHFITSVMLDKYRFVDFLSEVAFEAEVVAPAL